MTDTLREKTGRRLKRRLRTAVLVAALLCLSYFALWPKLFPVKCDHTDLVPHGLVQHRREIDIDKTNAAARSLLQLAVDRRLIGTDGATHKSQLAVASSVAVTHDENFSPTADVYTFKLPSIDPKYNFGEGLELSVTVNRTCGHVVDVTLSPKRITF